MKEPTISLLIPCRNEELFIEGVIQNILQQDFPIDEMEILFLDGMSTDRTPEIIAEYSENQPNIKIISNHAKFVPQAMNLGIQQAKGDIIIRLDAHAKYPFDYISKLIFWLKKLEADNVGGVWKIEPRSNSLKARAIAKVLAHPIGVGNALFRVGVSEPQEVDTVPFGCYPKVVFEKYGVYDERLQRNQDIELNKRIKRQGGKIVLIPEVECTYFARDIFRGLWKNNFDNGKWVILTAYFTRTLNSLSLRHFVPLGFFVYLLLGIFALLKISSVGFSILYGIVLAPLLLYFLVILFFSIKTSLEEKNIGMAPFLVGSFFTLHISYGLGSLAGIFLLLKNP